MARNRFDTAGEKRAFCRNGQGGGIGWLLAALLMAVAALPCAGCSNRRPPPPQMWLYVESDPGVNEGQVFYLAVRALSDKQFLTDSYQTVAGLLFADPPDKTVIGSFAVVPGTSQEFPLIQPEETPAAFYFLFTNPGDQWKKLLDQPIASAYNIRIHKDGSVTMTERRSTWKRILWPFGS